MREDRRERALVEAAGVGGDRAAPLDALGAVELGEIDGLGHLAPDAARAGRRGPRQPRARARPDLQGTRASAALCARGTRSSAPGGLGG